MCWGLNDVDPGHSVFIRDQCDRHINACAHTGMHMHTDILDGRYDGGWMKFCASGNGDGLGEGHSRQSDIDRTNG